MAHDMNLLGQPVGLAVPDWKAPPLPAREPLDGRYCRLEPLDVASHADSLYAANALDTDGKLWTYLPTGPFETLESYRAWVETASRSDDPLFYAIVGRSADPA